jgi:hypothetical protein
LTPKAGKQWKATVSYQNSISQWIFSREIPLKNCPDLPKADHLMQSYGHHLPRHAGDQSPPGWEKNSIMETLRMDS